MITSLCNFLKNIKNLYLLKRLHKLSVSAFSLDKAIQKSDLPIEVKTNSKELSNYYSTILINFNTRGV